MNGEEGLKKTMSAILTQAITDKVVGPVTIKATTTGNTEMYEDKYEAVAVDVCKNFGFIYGGIFVIHDDDGGKGFTRIKVTCYDTRTIVDYIKHLEKKEQVRNNPRQIINAWNRTIEIADHFNNMFGEGIHNKSKELNEINEIFDLVKESNSA